MCSAAKPLSESIAFHGRWNNEHRRWKSSWPRGPLCTWLIFTRRGFTPDVVAFGHSAGRPPPRSPQSGASVSWGVYRRWWRVKRLNPNSLVVLKPPGRVLFLLGFIKWSGKHGKSFASPSFIFIKKKTHLDPHCVTGTAAIMRVWRTCNLLPPVCVCVCVMGKRLERGRVEGFFFFGASSTHYRKDFMEIQKAILLLIFKRPFSILLCGARLSEWNKMMMLIVADSGEQMGRPELFWIV